MMRTFAAAELHAQNGNAIPRKVRSAAGTADENVGIIARHFKLRDRFLSDDGLVQKNVI